MKILRLASITAFLSLYKEAEAVQVGKQDLSEMDLDQFHELFFEEKGSEHLDEYHDEINSFAQSGVQMFGGNCDISFDDPLDKHFEEMKKKYNFEYAFYKTRTADNYYLNTIRIMRKGETKEDVIDRPPVLFMHGLIQSSESWIMETENGNTPLAIQALEAGYDVWLGNSRGTRFSNEHAFYEIDTDDYWNFEWSQMGLYDLDSIITLILSTADEFEKLNYIGYSQGTTELFYALAHDP